MELRNLIVVEEGDGEERVIRSQLGGYVRVRVVTQVLLLGQDTLDLPSEVIQRWRAGDEEAFDRVVRSRLADEKRRRPPDTRRDAFLRALLNEGPVLAALETRLEGLLVQLEPARVRLELLRLERLLISEESIVHLPVLSLVAGATGGLGGRVGQRVDLLDGKVAEDIPQLSGFDVLLLERRQRGLEELPAEGALVVG